jgi:hypothetical protein
MALFVLGERTRSQGEREHATAHYSESLALFRTAALYQFDYAGVQAALGECLALSRDLGHDGAIADGLVIAAGVADAQQHWERAATLLAAADMILGRFRVLYRVVDPSSYAEYTRRVEAVRKRLSEQSFAAAWATGRAMTRVQAIGYALADDAM